MQLLLKCGQPIQFRKVQIQQLTAHRIWSVTLLKQIADRMQSEEIMELQNKFVLYENNKSVSVLGSLSEATQAIQNKSTSASFRLELNAAPAKSRIWIFDNNASDWVEQV